MIIKSFGKISDIIRDGNKIEINFTSWMGLKEYLYTRYPELREEAFLVAKNHVLYQADADFEISPTDEIALMPPFSGG